MRSTPVRLAFVVIVFVAALVAGLLLLRGSDSGSTSGRGDGGGRTGAASSEIWKVGDSWTVQVAQDAGAISPDGTRSVAKVPFHFEVASAPKGAGGEWVVKVEQEGAEGPFAAGWRLHYREDDGEMVLARVAIGEDTPLEAELATIVLGNQFPYEPRYEAAPKDATITAAKLIERSTLPPATDVPGGAKPAGGPAGAPTAPPIDEAVVPGSAPAAPK